MSRTANTASERRILDALSIAVITADLEGRITSVHGTASRNGDLVPGDAIADAVPGLDPRRLEAALAELRGGGRRPVAIPLTSATGEARSVTIAPLLDGSMAYGMVLTVVDAPRSTTPDGADPVAHAAAGFARELRGPLTGIASAAQLLRFRMRDDPVVEKNVGRLLRETERLGRLAGSLAEFGRAEPLPLTPGDPELVWDRVIADLQGELESRSLKLRRTRAHGHPRVRIEPERLSTALSALLANAIEHSSDASDLVLEAEAPASGGWRCRLTSPGASLDDDTAARAFELFISTRPGASGLGLPLARRILGEHGGTVALERTDAGSVAIVELPAAHHA